MSNKPFDPTKPFQTRDGRSARIVENALKGRKDCLAVVATNSDGTEGLYSHYPDGRYWSGGESTNDLVNVPTKRTYSGWQNFYTDGTVGAISSTETEAANIRENYRKPCFACVFVTHEIEEGSGL